MKKLIIYCHGYGSSAKTPKVDRLRAVDNSVVYAWDIDVDPSVSIPQLIDNIDRDCNAHEPCQIVFVGTSLGGWYASKLADIYGADAVLINPSYNPSASLHKYGVPDHVCAKYDQISWNPKYKYYIAEDDDVIDFGPVADNLQKVDAVYVAGADHKFGGPEFDDVVAMI